MPGKSASIAVAITGEADFGAAQRGIEASFAKIEQASKSSVAEIEKAFSKADVSVNVDESGLSKATKDFDAFTAKLQAGSDVALTVDESDLKQAFDLAAKLGELTESVTITADADELKQAQALAQSLRSFTGRINLDVQGQQDLRAALGLAENLDQLRRVKVEVQGKEDLQRAGQIADDLERKRTIPIDAQLSDLKKLDTEVGAAGEGAGKLFSEKFAELDLGNVGGSITEQLGGLAAAAGPIAVVAGVVGAVFGESLAEGFNRAWNAKKDSVSRQISSGLDAATIGRVGKDAGDAYAAGFGDSFDQIARAGDDLESSLRGLDSALDLSKSIKESDILASKFGVELPEQVKLLTQLLANGLVKSTADGFNLLIESAQKFGDRTGDVFDIVTEFAPVFKKLGVTGATAFNIIGEEVRQGLVTQVDRAAEQFEEFNIRVTDGSARAAVEQLGLSFDDISQKLANGQGDKALAQVATALLNVNDAATRNTISLAIFGASIESASDPKKVLQLLATADAVGKIGTKGDEAVVKLQRTTTELDRLKRGAEELASSTGSLLSETRSQLVATAGAIAAPELILPLAVVDGFGRLKDAFFGADEKAKDLTYSAGEMIGTVVTGETPVQRLSVAAESLTTQLGFASKDAAGLKNELAGLFNFGADQLMRDIADAGDQLAESLKNGGAKAVELGGSIDISTKSGRDAQKGFEDLALELAKASQEYADGTITSGQLAAAQASVTDQFNRVTGSAHLTKQEVADLREKYLALPADVTTKLNAIDNASNAVKELQRTLDGIHDKTITITERHNAVYSSLSSSTQLGRASGGPVKKGQIYNVGEQGPELFLPNQDGQIIDATKTKALLDRLAPVGSFGGSSGGAVVAGGTSKVVNFNGPIVVDKGRDLFADLLLYEQIYSVAG